MVDALAVPTVVETYVAFLILLAAFESLGLFLRHADEDHAFGLFKLLAILRGKVVLALARLKMHDGDTALLRKGFDLACKVVSDPAQQGWRRNLVPPMMHQEADQLPGHLHRRDVAVQ